MPESIMSQLPSSSDLPPTPSITPGAVNEDQMRALLRGFFAEDLRPTFLEQLAARFGDPFRISQNSGFRLGTLWLGLGLFAVVALSTFLYFSFGRH
jgi:hypothetical protein